MIKITDNSAEVLKEIDNRINKALHTIDPLLVVTIQRDAPFVTGRYVRSINGIVDESEHKLTVGSNVEYAGYLEIGTDKMAPRAPLRRGLAKCLSGIKKIFRITTGGTAKILNTSEIKSSIKGSVQSPERPTF